MSERTSEWPCPNVWILDYSGPQCSRFRAAPEEESVVALTTDRRNEILITGDTKGQICVWNIQFYCGSAQNVSCFVFVDATTHLYKRVCPSVCHCVRMSVCLLRRFGPGKLLFLYIHPFRAHLIVSSDLLSYSFGRNDSFFDGMYLIIRFFSNDMYLLNRFSCNDMNRNDTFVTISILL